MGVSFSSRTPARWLFTMLMKEETSDDSACSWGAVACVAKLVLIGLGLRCAAVVLMMASFWPLPKDTDFFGKGVQSVAPWSSSDTDEAVVEFEWFEWSDAVSEEQRRFRLFSPSEDVGDCTS